MSELAQNGDIGDPVILRHQAEVHCRCLAVIAIGPQFLTPIYRKGGSNSPPYWDAADIFIREYTSDPLRTEILWLRGLFEWLD